MSKALSISNSQVHRKHLWYLRCQSSGPETSLCAELKVSGPETDKVSTNRCHLSPLLVPVSVRVHQANFKCTKIESLMTHKQPHVFFSSLFPCCNPWPMPQATNSIPFLLGTVIPQTRGARALHESTVVSHNPNLLSSHSPG